jgi:c-di-GMP-binding flagellar brake protein YcgR
VWKGFLDGLKGLIRTSAPEDWDYTERRQLIRLECQYDIEGKTAAGKKFKGQIVDMGLKGMKLRTFEQLKAGDLLAITYPVPILEIPNDTISCKVMWTQTRPRDYVLFAGLGYAEDEKSMARSWVKYLLKQLGFSKELIYQKRRYVRAECFVPAQMMYPGNHLPIDGRLYNLGVGGALVEFAAPLDEGAQVELRVGPYEDLPRFALPGRLVSRRAEARRFLHGIEFGQLSSAQTIVLGKYLFFLLRHQWTE